MQIKPCHSNFKVIRRHFLRKDDLGISFFLTEYSAHPKPLPLARDGFEYPTILIDSAWTVMSDNLHTHANGATSYEEYLMWDKTKEEKVEDLIIGEFEGIKYREVIHGGHAMIGGYPNGDGKLRVKTMFIISKE